MTYLMDTDGRHNAAAAQYIAETEREQRERDVTALGLYQDFMRAIRKGDMNAVATWAPMVRDHGDKSMRFPTVGEVLWDVLGYERANWPECLRIVCAVAYGDGPQGLAARAWLENAANVWAETTAAGMPL